MKWQDNLTRKAFSEGYRARSVFKLEEIDNKFDLVKVGFNVLDLGCHPGSWLKWCAKKVGKTGFVIGVDIKFTERLAYDNMVILKQDVFEFDTKLIDKYVDKIDLVCSDMAPNTTGSKDLDKSRSHALALQALIIAILVSKNNFVVKYFQGPDNEELISIAKKYFNLVKTFKPKSSRSKSVEMFLICKERNEKKYDEEDF